MKSRFNFGYLIAGYVPIMILVPFYCYYEYVYKQHGKPFPSKTITQTACNYPQDIVFRFFMLLASSMLALIFFVIFRWVDLQVKRTGYSKNIHKYLFYLAQLSILFYGVTIGTIDSRSTGKLHGPCAVAFFLILIVNTIQVTIFITQLREFDTSIISRTSLTVKQILAGYVSLVWIYCLTMMILDSQMIEGKTDKYAVIVEWNTVAICLGWVLSFYWEWKDIYLCLKWPKNIEGEGNGGGVEVNDIQ